MHHRNSENTNIWIDAAGRELVSRLVPGRPTCDEVKLAMQYASKARARHFCRWVYRFKQALRHLIIPTYKG